MPNPNRPTDEDLEIKFYEQEQEQDTRSMRCNCFYNPQTGEEEICRHCSTFSRQEDLPF